MAEVGVKLYIYDISKGLARSMSQVFLGRHINGIWHTGIVVHGTEFYFGSAGIQTCAPCGTILGQPDRIEDMGCTEIPHDTLMDYLVELSTTSFRPDCYHLLDHNCNTFSSELSQFLTGKDIPAEITNLPTEVMSTPFGQMLRPFLDSMSSSGGDPLSFNSSNNNIHPQTASVVNDTARPDAAVKTTAPRNFNNTRESPSPTQPPMSEIKPLRRWAWYKDKRTPIMYKDTIEQMLSSAGTDLAELEQHCGAETFAVLRQTIDGVIKNDALLLTSQHINTLCRVIMTTTQSESSRHFCINLLATCLLQGDIKKMLISTSVCPAVQTYATLPRRCKLALLKLIANVLSSNDGYKCLEPHDAAHSAVVDALLTEGVDSLFYEHVAAAAHNLTLYTAGEDDCIDIASALLQCLQGPLSCDAAEKMLVALMRLMNASDLITSLAQAMGVDWATMAVRSPEISTLVDIIIQTLS